MSAPTEALGREPNYDRAGRQWYDIRPHGTEARARRERRHGQKPCPSCLAAEQAAHAYRERLRAAASATTSPEARAS